MLSFSFKHVGVAVISISKAIESYKALFNYSVLSGPFEDPIQGVTVCFLGSGERHDVTIELVEPLSEDSPVSRTLAKGIGAYHVCYGVRDLDEAIAHFRSNGCLALGQPVPAVAFGGRRIAWLYAPTRQLIELLEEETESAKS